jgi:hypothetical protein
MTRKTSIYFVLASALALSNLVWAVKSFYDMKKVKMAEDAVSTLPMRDVYFVADNDGKLLVYCAKSNRRTLAVDKQYDRAIILSCTASKSEEGQ